MHIRTRLKCLFPLLCSLRMLAGCGTGAFAPLCTVMLSAHPAAAQSNWGAAGDIIVSGDFRWRSRILRSGIRRLMPSTF